MEISNHTLLVNQMIGLCKRVDFWPSTLRDLGYSVEQIEPSLKTSSGEVINPDIRLTSNRLLHTLIVECKGGSVIDDSQIDKYSLLTRETIINETTVYDPTRLEFEVTFACCSEFKDIIQKRIGMYPLFTFSNEFIKKENNFENTALNTAFSAPIKLPDFSKPPVSFYPFDDQDNSSFIALHVFQQLLVLAYKGNSNEILINTDEILKRIFQQMWENIHEKKKKKIRSKVNNILTQYTSRSDLSGYLEKIRGKQTWRISRSLEAFRNRCQKIIEDLEKQPTMQSTISNYERSGES